MFESRSNFHRQLGRLRAAYREWYSDVYLQTDHWKQARIAALKRGHHRCAQCGTTRALEVHHVCYERFFDEHQDDLIVLCAHCHEDVHWAMKDQRKLNDWIGTLQRRGRARHSSEDFDPQQWWQDQVGEWEDNLY
jgi:phage terminase large subunit GpA-like protein